MLAIEDSDFFAHGALDWSSLIRAMIENARAGKVVQGGSTITQQLVGSTLGENVFDQSVEGKLQELALAIRVEQQYSKRRIFELYLNQVYMGNGVYGFGTASEFYFRKPPRDLNAPGGSDPRRDGPGARVLRPARSAEEDAPSPQRRPQPDGGPRIDLRGAERAAQGEALAAAEGRREGASSSSAVLRPIPDRADRREQPRESSKRSVAPRRRAAARCTRVVSTSTRRSSPDGSAGPRMPREQPLRVSIFPPAGSPPPDVSIVTIDNRTGAVKVILSGRNYRKDELDLATTGHQPGSAFKPFVLAGAFKRGIPPTQTYSSSSPWCSPLWDDDDHCVENAEGGGQGTVDLWTATEDSINVVFAQLIFDVGASVVADVTERMIGMDPRTEGLQPVPALATGSVAISPIDMAAGYQTIANDGKHCEPYTVQSIERDGKVVLAHERTCDPVLKQGDARLDHRRCWRPFPSPERPSSAFGVWGDRPVAGKTGTAQENTNVWFGGYTRQYTTVVWVGSPGNPYPMGHVFGGTVAAPIWVAYMSQVMQGLPAIGFPDPPKPPEGPVPSVIGMNEGRGERDPHRSGVPRVRVDRRLLQPEGTGLQPVSGRRDGHAARHDGHDPGLDGGAAPGHGPPRRRHEGFRRQDRHPVPGVGGEDGGDRDGESGQGRLRHRPGSRGGERGGPGHLRDDLRRHRTQGQRRRRWW